MNSAKCPVCQAQMVPIYRTELPGAPWMHTCPVCGHAAAQPMPASSATEYDDAYTAGPHAERKNRRLAGDYLEKIRPFLPPVPFRFLDVGGSHGWLAQAVRDACGAEVLLLEPGRSAVESARARGLRAERGFLGAFQTQEKFDVVCAAHVIEHVTDAAEFVSQCAALLRPGGLLILLTPNAGAWKLARFRGHWAWAVPRDHTLFLSAPSARRLLVAHGLDPIAVRGCVPGLAHYPFFLVRWMAEHGVPRVARWPFLLVERALLGFVDALAGPGAADELLIVARRADS